MPDVVRGPAAAVVEQVAAWLVEPAEPAPLIVETSGSTGAPKRVRLSRAAVLASGAATAQVLGAQGQWVLALPATYVAGLQVIARSLSAGYDPVLLEDHADVAGAAAAMATGVPRFISLVPTQLHRLLVDVDSADVDALRGFHAVLLGGGPIDPALRARAEAAGVRVVATYGSAETSGGCVYDAVPLPGVDLRTDADARVWVRGPMLFDGYDGDADLTGQVLVDGWFATSDAGRIVDGRLELFGRVDDMVVSGGLNIPGGVVARRLRTHPDVTAAEVLGVEDAEWGRRLVAFAVSSRADLDAESLRDWVAQEHPRAWAPRQIEFVPALPLLANGKTDRRALLEQVAR